MKKGKCKKYIIRYISVLSCTLCIFALPFLSSAATNNNDISVVFNDINKLTDVFMDIGGRYTAGTVSKFTSGSFRAVYRNVDVDNSVLALFSYEPSADTYATIQSSYHYTIEFDLDYMMVNDSGRIQSGVDWQFVLFTDSFPGSTPSVPGDSSAYSISIPVKCTSKSVTGTVEHLRFDFDFYPPENYPNFDGELELLGWGLYLYGYSSTYSRIQLTVNNLNFKSYTPDEWQTAKIQEGFDNIHSQVVQGLDEFNNSFEYDFSEGQGALNEYKDMDGAVNAMIDTDAINDSLNIDSTLNATMTGIKAAGGFVDYLYKNVLTYYGIIPIAVCFSGVALLLGLVKNR